MIPPVPTPILRFTHVDNLDTIIRRDGIHAPNHVPDDGLMYRFCHSAEVHGGKTKGSGIISRRGIVDDLESALEQFRLIANDLGKV